MFNNSLWQLLNRRNFGGCRKNNSNVGKVKERVNFLKQQHL